MLKFSQIGLLQELVLSTPLLLCCWNCSIIHQQQTFCYHMGSIPAVCTPHWHLCCPRNHRRWCPKCHWHTTPLFQACYRRIQIAEFHQMCKTLENEVNFVHYMFTCRDAVWQYTYLNTWFQHWKLVSRRLELVNIQSEMLHLHHSETEQGSMEAVVSHKRYSYMKLHLCKKATNLNHVTVILNNST